MPEFDGMGPRDDEPSLQRPIVTKPLDGLDRVRVGRRRTDDIDDILLELLLVVAPDELDDVIAGELSECLGASITPEVDVTPMVRAKLRRARRGALED